MVFLDGPHQAAGRRNIFLHAAGYAAFLFLGAMVLPGCGGGGGGETNPNPTPTPNTSATVEGRVVESTTGANISGAVVRLGGLSFTTGADGQFSFQVPGGGDARTLTVELLPAGEYYGVGSVDPSGVVAGNSCVSLATTGIPIARENLESGDVVRINNVNVYNLQTGPPPPPLCSL